MEDYTGVCTYVTCILTILIFLWIVMKVMKEREAEADAMRDWQHAASTSGSMQRHKVHHSDSGRENDIFDTDSRPDRSQYYVDGFLSGSNGGPEFPGPTGSRMPMDYMHPGAAHMPSEPHTSEASLSKLL